MSLFLVVSVSECLLLFEFLTIAELTLHVALMLLQLFVSASHELSFEVEYALQVKTEI